MSNSTVAAFSPASVIDRLSVPPAPTFPVIIDVNAIPVKPKRPTGDGPFTHPRPRQITWKGSIAARVFRVRRMLVVTDEDIAKLYNTTIDLVNKTVLRNACMFPRSACFRMSVDEWHHLKAKYKIEEKDRGDWLTTPLAFSREGIHALAKIMKTYDAIRGCIILLQDISAIISERGNGRAIA